MYAEELVHDAGSSPEPSTTAPLVMLIPPGPGGLADYANTVNRYLGARIVECSPETPLADFGHGDLLVHLSGYGYHRHGAPAWLVERLRQARPQLRRLGVFFHELYAWGPPWRTAFWVSYSQRRVAAGIASIADFWLTNRASSGRWLRRVEAATPLRVLPVCSNVGEPSTAVGFERQRQIVVFGSGPVRAATYRALEDTMLRWTADNGYKIHDIGPAPDSETLARLQGAGNVTVHGKLPAHEVSAHLSAAMYGIVRYSAYEIAKSGIFAAYSAHGTCPVLLSDGRAPDDGLAANRHYADGFEKLTDPQFDGAAVGRAAYDWYQPHGVLAHADAIRSMFGEAGK